MSAPGRNNWITRAEPNWGRLEVLLEKSTHTKALLKPAEIREMALLYRGAVNDLARAQSSPALQHLEPYLNNLVQRCHGRVYERPPARMTDVLQFFRQDFPRTFRKHFRFVVLAFLMFALGTTIALITVHQNPDTERFFLPQSIISQLDRGHLWTDQSQANPSESSFLMTNNIRVAINAFAFGIVFGVGTLVLLLHNGLFAFGGPLQVTINHHMGHRLLTFITAHGVIELTTIFIAGAAGMVIGFTLLFPGDLPRWQAVRQNAGEALILIMGCAPLLVIAGLIEGMVSLNQSIGLPTRIAVAILSVIFLVAYLGFSGRDKAPTKNTP